MPIDRHDPKAASLEAASLENERRIQDLTDRLEATAKALAKSSRSLSRASLNKAISGVIDHALKTQQRAFERQVQSLLKETATAALGNSLGNSLGGKSSFFSTLSGFLPGFARGGILGGGILGGGILGRRTVLAHSAESGPEVILPLKKGADGRLGVVAQSGRHADKSKVKASPTPIEVTLVAPAPATLSADDQERIADAVLQAMDQAIDERLALHLENGGLMRRNERKLWS